MDTQALLDKYPIEEHKEIHKLRLEVFKQEQLKALSEHPAGKFLIEYLQLLTKGINEELLADKPMDNEYRALLLDRRKTYMMMVSLFSYSEKRLEGLEDFIQSKLD